MEFLDKVKNHIKENKEIYFTAGINFSIAVITATIMRELHTVPVKSGSGWSERISMGSLNFFAKDSGNMVTTIHNGSKGHPGFITRCIETGELFATQGSAARAFNIPERTMTKHLNYGRELSENLHFERLGILQ